MNGSAGTRPGLEAGTGLEPLVGVIAESPVARRMVEILVRDCVTVVGWAETAGDLAAACLDSQPHVVVLSWDGASSDGAAAMRVISSAMPRTRMVVVLREQRRSAIRSALRAGADGAVVERELGLTLAVVVRAVWLGQASIPLSARVELGDQTLSAREREVLELVSQGLTNSAVATRLCLAQSTVKSHLAAAFSKLGVHSREEAAALMREHRRGSHFEGAMSADSVADVVKGGAV
jgi:DNA-binding NarL/FixJ family response regulator